MLKKYSYPSKSVVTDIDERLNRLERIVRSTILEPADVPVGTPMVEAVNKVEKAAKQVRALANAIVKPKPERLDIMSMAMTKAGLRQQVANLRYLLAECEDANAKLAKQVTSVSRELAEAKDAYWKVKIDAANEKAERDNKLRQFVKETTGRA